MDELERISVDESWKLQKISLISLTRFKRNRMEEKRRKKKKIKAFRKALMTCCCLKRVVHQFRGINLAVVTCKGGVCLIYTQQCINPALMVLFVSFYCWCCWKKGVKIFKKGLQILFMPFLQFLCFPERPNRSSICFPQSM